MGSRFRRSISQFVTGGEWALSLPDQIRHNLRWFWLDGFFAAASENIIITYLVLYILALGGTRAQIGLMSSLSSLSAALLLLPGALLVERIGRRKQITLLAGGGVGRLALVLLPLIPLVFSGQPLVYSAIALSVLRDASNNLAYPAWMSLTADIVPLEGRGRYFASRNFAIGIAGMAITLLAGELITHSSQPAGFQVALGFAAALGITATFCFSRLLDLQPGIAPGAGASMSIPSLLRDLKNHSGFLAFCATAALWNFSLNVAGPFFTVYLVQDLKATASMVGLTSIAASVSGLLVQRKLGELADRWGARRMQLISGLLIPILPIAWIFARSPWHIIPINLLSGILWGAYTLASFNLLLSFTPEAQRARYSALYQITILISLAAGAAVGSLMVTQWGYIAVFLGSGVGRLIAAFLFARFVRTKG